MARAARVHVNRFEILFDWRVGANVRRIRMQRGMIDYCQGRRLGAEEATALVRERAREIRGILVSALRGSVDRPTQAMDLRPALGPERVDTPVVVAL